MYTGWAGKVSLYSNVNLFENRELLSAHPVYCHLFKTHFVLVRAHQHHHRRRQCHELMIVLHANTIYNEIPKKYTTHTHTHIPSNISSFSLFHFLSFFFFFFISGSSVSYRSPPPHHQPGRVQRFSIRLLLFLFSLLLFSSIEFASIRVYLARLFKCQYISLVHRFGCFSQCKPMLETNGNAEQTDYFKRKIFY